MGEVVDPAKKMAMQKSHTSWIFPGHAHSMISMVTVEVRRPSGDDGFAESNPRDNQSALERPG